MFLEFKYTSVNLKKIQILYIKNVYNLKTPIFVFEKYHNNGNTML